MAQINQPMYILRDDTERFQGNQALRNCKNHSRSKRNGQNVSGQENG